MKLPRMTIREAIAWVALVALAIAWVSEAYKGRARDMELGVLRARALDPCP